MSIIAITKDDVEQFTVVTTPRRHSSSGSTHGITGSVKVFPRLSPIERDTAFVDVKTHTDVSFDSAAANITAAAKTGRTHGANNNIFSLVDDYIDLVESSSLKKTAVLDVERFTPTTTLTKRTLQKNNIRDVLMSYYRTEYPHAHWAYTNYNALNFFTAYSGSTPLILTSSVLLYPNVFDPDLQAQPGHVSGSYCLSGAFSFDFCINPRYKVDGIDVGEFKAGTIFHLSSSYSLSLVTGSLKDGSGLPEGFRLKLQLSQSTDIPPSLAVPGPYPNDLVFLSDDNSLVYNNWHHVVVRWGTNLCNNGTGSFIIDGVNKGDFIVPSGTIMPEIPTNSLNPDVLCIGNFYEGDNLGLTAQSLFFDNYAARRDGLYQLTNQSKVGPEGPDRYLFNHPLKAEIHDLIFRRYYMSDGEISFTGSRGIGNDALRKDHIAFYLPPFFVEDSPIRRFVNDSGGILQTPFFAIDGTTDDPFNVAMSFGVDGHYINLENFVKDFATGRFPRLLGLTGSTIDHTTDAREANEFLYQNPEIAKRNLTVLPCDDGNFDPNYEILSNERFTNKYVDSHGVEDLSYITLDNLVTTASLRAGGLSPYDPDSESHRAFSEILIGPSPETPGLEPGTAYNTYVNGVTASLASTTDDLQFDRGIQRGVPLTIYQRLLDPSSNQITVFNISNLYYGRRIQPGSFVLRDATVSGSYGSVSLTIRDDGAGNLYRGDSVTPHATQNSVGNIFYDEGIVLIKSPHLYFFGKDQYEINFKGVQNIFSTKYEILAPPGLLNSSSNATYIANKDALRASGGVLDNEVFVYISGMYFHDDNMNVVAKVKLAQPVIKRETDKILFKVSLDF